jgi:hypothetical protein
MPIQYRIHSLDEVVKGLTPDETLDECRRCLRCDLRATVGPA